jgi:hypothetical protein
MNADFGLPLTGAIARRFLYLNTVMALDLDPKIKDIAKTGLLDQQDDLIPIHPIARAATQFMHDCGFRCGMPSFSDYIDIPLVLSALKAGNISQITISSHNTKHWKSALRNYHFDDVQIFSHNDAFQPENQDGRRDGVMIIDWTNTQMNYLYSVMRSIATEFPKTIVFMNQGVYGCSRNDYYNDFWYHIATIIYPDMPTCEIAMLYNVFLPEYANKPGYNFA